jgi:hypothetical protein
MRIFKTCRINIIQKVIALCVLMSVSLIIASTPVMADMTAKEQSEAQKKAPQ